MNCVIIEDQVPAQRILKRYISEYGDLNIVGIFNNVIDFNKTIFEEEVDLIFLDIHLPKVSGIDFLNNFNPKCSVILTTAFDEYALKGYEFGVVDYLLKPFSFIRFCQAVSKVEHKRFEAVQDRKPQHVFVKSGYEYQKIIFGEIHFIKSSGDYTEIHLDGKRIVTHYPLKKWLSMLDETLYCQIHKSYIINTRYALKIKATSVSMSSGKELPIGRAYKDNLTPFLLKGE